MAFALLLGVGIAAIYQTYAWDRDTALVSGSWQAIDRIKDLSSCSGEACAQDVGRIADLTAGDSQARALLGRNDQPGALARELEAHERLLLDSVMQEQGSVVLRTRRLFGVAAFLSFTLIILAGLRAAFNVRKRDAAERTLALREEQYRQVVELAGDIIYRTDNAGRFTFCNHASLAALHLTQDEVIGRSYLRLMRPDYRKQAQRFYLRQAARWKKNSYFEFPIVDGHGRERWLGQNAQLLVDDGIVVGFQAIAREITERRRAEAELETSRAFVERIAATTPGILYVYDLDEKRNVYSNREVISVLGYSPGEVRAEYFHPDDAPALRGHHEALRLAQDGEVRRIDYRVRHADGHWVWLAARDTPFLRKADGDVKQVVGIAQDITTRKVAQEQLAWQANYDALTGLANRHHFRTRLQSLLRRASVEHGTASLCILDVDLFKEINDRYGHAAGDEVLEAVGSITRSEIRSIDVAGRLGGDEFCFLLPDTDQNEAARVADRIRERLCTMAFGMHQDGTPFSVTATFGVAQWKPQMDAKELMEASDRALYRAKAAGRNRVCVDI